MAKSPKNVRDTVAVLRNLDLLITTDTAIAHVAGALGVPTWLALSHVPDWRWLLDRDLLVRPYHVQFVLGVPGGMTGSERNLRFLVEGLPEPTHWSVAGIGRFELPMAEVALRLGGHVRVGLEDNLFASKGVLARGSDELVAQAAALARKAGRTPATPSQARRILGIS